MDTFEEVLTRRTLVLIAYSFFYSSLADIWGVSDEFYWETQFENTEESFQRWEGEVGWTKRSGLLSLDVIHLFTLRRWKNFRGQRRLSGPETTGMVRQIVKSSFLSAGRKSGSEEWRRQRGELGNQGTPTEETPDESENKDKWSSSWWGKNLWVFASHLSLTNVIFFQRNV